ncbi:MAG TPA: hypothetical protein VMU50_01120 [Polyangia bacterium]|nr:hypothetical protein [Polyangia bacterium]
MIGCVLATLGVIGLAKVAHARRYGCYAGPCGGGFWRRHHHGFGRFHHCGWHHGGPTGGDFDDDFGPGSGAGHGRFFLRGALDSLEMTPAQERVVFAAWEEMRDAGRELRGELRASRKDIAASFRKPVHDEVLFGELYARHDRALEALRKAFVGATAKVHEALDERQRARLADLIESGPRVGRGFYRPRWSW